jgi:hypothetical protein
MSERPPAEATTPAQLVALAARVTLRVCVASSSPDRGERALP